MKPEAIKRQGARHDLTSTQVAQKLSVEKVAEDSQQLLFDFTVGYIELPEATPSNNYKADTRKGVSVEYLPKPLSA